MEIFTALRNSLKTKRILVTPLRNACLQGDLETVKLLVENGTRVDKKLLYFASMRGRSAIVRFLLESGAEVNERSYNGDTALHRACGPDAHYSDGLMYTLDTVSLLLQHGADPYICNDRGQIAADIARFCSPKRQEILQLFRIHDYFAREEQGDDFKEEYEFRRGWKRKRKKLQAAPLKDIIHDMVKYPQHVEKFVTIFRKYPDIIYWTDDKGRSVMHVACKDYHGVIIKGLMEASTLLDLLLWKLKMEETSTTTSTANDRKKCYVTCGSDVVIPKVMEFLGIDVLKQHNKKARIRGRWCEVL